MIPISQNLFYDPDPSAIGGNCFQACVASIFELDLECVPHFCADQTDGRWFLAFDEWCRKNYGLQPILLRYPFTPHGVFFGEGYAIRSGHSARGCLHSVVVLDGNVVHDPHPDRSGLLDHVDDIFFVVRDPALHRRRKAEDDRAQAWNRCERKLEYLRALRGKECLYGNIPFMDCPYVVSHMNDLRSEEAHP